MIKRRLFCRSIVTRTTDEGHKTTFSFKRDELKEENEILEVKITHMGNPNSAWLSILDELEHNDRIEITIEAYDPKQTRLEQ